LWQVQHRVDRAGAIVYSLLHLNQFITVIIFHSEQESIVESIEVAKDELDGEELCEEVKYLCKEKKAISKIAMVSIFSVINVMIVGLSLFYGCLP
jgi:hypothetical protein